MLLYNSQPSGNCYKVRLLPAIREVGGNHGPPQVEPDVNPVHRLIIS